MSLFFSAMRKLFGRAVPPDSQDKGVVALHALEKCWRTELSAFEATLDAEHLQAAADSLYRAIRQTHGKLASVVAFQAGGWPRPWERSFSSSPATGDKSCHDALLFEMLKDFGEGLGQWEDLPNRDVLTVLDRILIRRNRRNSPFREFGKAANSGHWPHDDSDRRA